MKNQKELNVLKQEYKALSAKLHELSEDELKEVVGSGELEDYSEKIRRYLEALLNPEAAYKTTGLK